MLMTPATTRQAIVPGPSLSEPQSKTFVTLILHPTGALSNWFNHLTLFPGYLENI